MTSHIDSIVLDPQTVGHIASMHRFLCRHGIVIQENGVITSGKEDIERHEMNAFHFFIMKLPQDVRDRVIMEHRVRTCMRKTDGVRAALALSFVVLAVDVAILAIILFTL